jgi:hypothetical protein
LRRGVWVHRRRGMKRMRRTMEEKMVSRVLQNRVAHVTECIVIFGKQWCICVGDCEERCVCGIKLACSTHAHTKLTSQRISQTGAYLWVSIILFVTTTIRPYALHQPPIPVFPRPPSPTLTLHVPFHYLLSLTHLIHPPPAPPATTSTRPLSRMYRCMAQSA